MQRTVGLIAAAATCLAAGLIGAGPASAAPSLRFHGAQYDSPGSDTRTNASLNAEWVSFVNTGSRAVNLRGYTIRDKAGHVFTFGSVSIAGNGGRLWLHTGSGTANARNQYWRSGNYIWNNTGDTAYLRTSGGSTVDTCTWGYKAGRNWVAC